MKGFDSGTPDREYYKYINDGKYSPTPPPLPSHWVQEENTVSLRTTVLQYVRLHMRGV